MALKIRLKQHGCKNKQTYRVVVADAKCRRDGKYIEKLGWYVPYLEENSCKIDAERMTYWLKNGAQMSDQVKALAAKNAPEALKTLRADQDAVQQRKVEKRREKKKAAKA
jgi:small subunit ribosomal protein S16